MPEADTKFLVGRALSAAIREVCGARDVDCAVAFWGVNIRETLLPRWGDGGRFRVICDISQGATCRLALEQLEAPKNKRLRVADSFHGKVYISDRGAVIGSPNASDNGVGLRSGRSGRLLETGIFCPPGSRAHRQAKKWFNTFYRSLSHVDEIALNEAPERSGELRPRAPAKVIGPLSLLQRLALHPQNFKGIRIAVATGHINQQMADASKAERVAARPKAAADPIDDVILQNDGDPDFKSFTGPVLLLWRLRTVTNVSAYLDCSTWPPGKPDTVFGVDEWITFWNELGQPAPLRRLSEADSKTIGRFFEDGGEKWMFDPEEFAERLAKLASPEGAASISRPIVAARVDAVGNGAKPGRQRRES